MEPMKVDFTKKGKSGVKDILIPPEKAGIKILINIVITIIAAAVAYYFILPPMNLKANEFYIFFAIVLGSYVGSAVLTTKVLARPEYIPYVRRQATVPVIIAIIFGVIFGAGYISSAIFFRAKAYSQILEVNEDADFSASVTAIKSISDFDKVPLIDVDAAKKLANAALGEIGTSGFVSQFTLADMYSTQINYRGSPYRIFPLQYGDVFKWIKQTKSGVPGYILVNMNTSKAEFVTRNTEGEDVSVKYSPSEHFGRYLMRMLRFQYPTYIFGVPSFEVDDAGNPYWIVEHIDKTVGLLGGEDVVGVIMMNAATGESEYHLMDEIKRGVTDEGANIAWMDQIFDADLLLKQYDYYGKYSNGFINAYIGQEDVKVTTNLCSFLAIDDDVYMYTGVTSITADESIIGFVLINQRTKEASFYRETGATERVAQDSAQGIVQDKNWKATFPLLINLDGVPTYFMALKDSADVVKSYAMVNVNQYSDAVRSPSDDNPDLRACLAAYISRVSSRYDINVDLGDGTSSGGNSEVDDVYISGVITDKRAIVENGYTVYYVKLAEHDAYFVINASRNKGIVVLDVGDTVDLVVDTEEGEFINANVGTEKHSPAVEESTDAPEGTTVSTDETTTGVTE